MQNKITTLENRLKAMTDYRKLLVGELKAAIRIYDQLNAKEKAGAFGAVSAVKRIRHQIYEKAAELGYVKRYKDVLHNYLAGRSSTSATGATLTTRNP